MTRQRRADRDTDSVGERQRPRVPPAEWTQTPAWWLFRGTGVPLERADRDARWPVAPPWRRFLGPAEDIEPPDDGEEPTRRLGTVAAALLDADDVSLVNAAIYLRRPILVTGKPGSGKSSLAYVIARELGLGRVLRWAVTSRTTLRDGVYEYDAIGRAQAALQSRSVVGDRNNPAAKGIGKFWTESRPPNDGERHDDREPPPANEFVRLGPLGTALLPRKLPRVLLVDELDKGDFDLPNDLLNVFEDGYVVIPELARMRSSADRATVLTDDPGHTAVVHSGTVRCAEFPIVVMTSNGEREFPPAFLRRCTRLDVEEPRGEKLDALVQAHFGSSDEFTELVRRFESQRNQGDELAADQLLNAIHLAVSGAFDGDSNASDELLGAIWRSLSPGSGLR